MEARKPSPSTRTPAALSSRPGSNMGSMKDTKMRLLSEQEILDAKMEAMKKRFNNLYSTQNDLNDIDTKSSQPNSPKRKAHSIATSKHSSVFGDSEQNEDLQLQQNTTIMDLYNQIIASNHQNDDEVKITQSNRANEKWSRLKSVIRSKSVVDKPAVRFSSPAQNRNSATVTEVQDEDNDNDDIMNRSNYSNNDFSFKSNRTGKSSVYDIYKDGTNSSMDESKSYLFGDFESESGDHDTSLNTSLNTSPRAVTTGEFIDDSDVIIALLKDKYIPQPEIQLVPQWPPPRSPNTTAALPVFSPVQNASPIRKVQNSSIVPTLPIISDESVDAAVISLKQEKTSKKVQIVDEVGNSMYLSPRQPSAVELSAEISEQQLPKSPLDRVVSLSLSSVRKDVDTSGSSLAQNIKSPVSPDTNYESLTATAAVTFTKVANQEVTDNVEANQRTIASASVSDMAELEEDIKFAQILNDFHTKSKSQALAVNKIAPEKLDEYNTKMSQFLLKSHMKYLEEIKKKEIEFLWKQQRAHDQIREIEKKSEVKALAEKEKLVEREINSKHILRRNYEKIKENLEIYLSKEHAVLREKFGEVMTSDSTIARKYYVHSRRTPQPIEMRIHILRAIKTKLPKGRYVLMLTQFDSLGGKPLAWSKVGMYGIGNKFPAVTKPAKHGGRYFDRILKVEDSVYALCPPRSSTRPSFVFVLELFELASKSCPHDRVVGWTALPMCCENLSIVEGKYRLPLLRGHHSPKTTHFAQLDEALSLDLSNWLCNVYVEVRHLPTSTLKTIRSDWENVTLQFDYLSKQIHSTLNYTKEEKLQEKLKGSTIKGKGIKKGIMYEINKLSPTKPNRMGVEDIDEYIVDHDMDNLDENGLLKIDKNIFIREKPQMIPIKLHDVESRSNSNSSLNKVYPISDAPMNVNAVKELTKNEPTNEILNTVLSSENKRIKPDANVNNHNNNENNVNDLSLIVSEEKRVKPHSPSKEVIIQNQEASPVSNFWFTSAHWSSLWTSVSAPSTTNNKQKYQILPIDISPSKLTPSGAPVAIVEEDNMELGKGKDANNNIIASNFQNQPITVYNMQEDPVNTTNQRAISISQSQLQNKVSFDKLEGGHTQVVRKHNMYTDGNDVNVPEEIFERGYGSNDEEFLHDEQRGKLVGLESVMDKDGKKWAETCQNETVVRRWNADGARFDSEAIAIAKNKNKSTTSFKQNGNSFKDSRGLNRSSISLNSHGDRKNSRNFKDSLSQMSDVDADGDLSENDDDEDTTSRRSFKSVSSLSRARLRESKEKADEQHRWHELTDGEEMDTYTPSVAADPAMRKKPMPGKLVRSKLKYIYLEAFGDLDYHNWGTFDFFMTIGLYIIAAWMRLFVHFIGQFLYLSALGTPVFGFQVYPLFISFKYISTSISVGADIGVVTMGSISCIIAFLLLAFAGWMLYKFAKFSPESYSKFVIAFGMATILDPLLIMFIDLCYHHYDCQQVSAACAESYTSADCNCYNGDFVKLWVHMLNLEGSGITGAIMTVIIYIGVMVISLLLVYVYLIYVHRDAHILDIWRRINGDTDDFFIPDDFEVSLNELRSICVKASQWRGIDGSLREVIITSYETDLKAETYGNHEKYFSNSAHYMTYKQESGYLKRYLILQKNKLRNETKLYRQFIMLKNGAIIEIFEQYKSKSRLSNVTTILPSRLERKGAHGASASHLHVYYPSGQKSYIDADQSSIEYHSQVGGHEWGSQLDLSDSDGLYDSDDLISVKSRVPPVKSGHISTPVGPIPTPYKVSFKLSQSNSSPIRQDDIRSTNY